MGGLDVERVQTRNIDPNKAAVHARQTPSTGATDLAALVASQEATSGAGRALLATSANASVAAATIQGPGVLLELKDSTGTVQFSVPQTGHVNGAFGPADHGFVGWSMDPGVYGSSTPLSVTAGTAQVIKILIGSATSITNIWMQVQTAAVGGTSGQNFAAVYSSAKALLATTADQTTAWGSGGLKQMTISSTAISPPHIYVVWFYNAGTSAPRFLANVSGTSAVNGNLTAANARFATADTGLTTAMPTTLGTFTASGQSVWAAVS